MVHFTPEGLMLGVLIGLLIDHYALPFLAHEWFKKRTRSDHGERAQ